MRNNIFKLIVTASVMLTSCGDEQQYFPEITNEFLASAQIKFIHAASDTVGVNLFLDGTKITGNSFSTITTFGSVNLGKVNIGTVTFQNAFPLTDYTSAPGSSGTFTVVFPESYNATTTFPTKTLSTVASPTLDASSYYTAAFVGVYPTHETVIYQDDLSQAPLDGNAYIRFANFIPNYTDNLSLVGTPPGGTQITLLPNVAYKGMTAFIALPMPGAYTNVNIINTTTNAVVATLAAGSSSFVNNKVYTVFARGRVGGTGTAVLGVSRTTNR